MKLETLTYELVREQIIEMIDAGEKITVRNVLARVGGTTAIIASYVKQWHLEQRINIDDDNFSTDLKRAIIIDRKKAIKEAIASYTSKYLDLTNLLTETEQLLSEKDNSHNKLANDFKDMQLKADNDKIRLETQIQALEKSQDNLKQQLEMLQNRFEAITDDKYAAIKDSAVWEAKYRELQQKLKAKN